MQTSKCHQVLSHPFRQPGGLHIVMEWGHTMRNVGLQHKVSTHFGQLNVIVAKGAEYGRVNTTYHR
jgi:hypothetical protein